jgi:hypothetical protein
MEKSKAKREIPDNAPDWLEPLLLKQPFAYDVDAPIEIVSNALHSLEIPSTNFFQQRMRTVLVEVGEAGELTFTIKAKMRARSTYTPSAICRGVLVPDGQTTVVRGYTRLAMFGIFGLIAPIVGTLFIMLYMVGAFTFMRMALSYLLIFFIMIVIVLGFTYWRFTQLRDDRYKITHDLRGAINAAELSKPKRGGEK